MYFHPTPHIPLTLAQMDVMARRFLEVKDPGALAALLRADAADLKKWAAKPQYHEFRIPKPGGLRRTIHNPHHELKEIQHRLNGYFQALYYTLKPACAYGFIPRPTDEPHPRNIYTNALRHMGRQWVLNLDLKDFFHTITTRHLVNIIGHIEVGGVDEFLPKLPAVSKLAGFNDCLPLLDFPEKVATQLIALATCRGVLPMGAPTSPVLSNLICLPLDWRLQHCANAADMTYTRFVDDLTFSSDAEPTPDQIAEIRATIENHGFTVNEGKLKLTRWADGPEVTGLILKNPRPDLSPAFLAKVRRDIKLFRTLLTPDLLQRGVFHPSIFEKFQRSIEGQIQFVGFVRGRADGEYAALREKMGGGF